MSRRYTHPFHCRRHLLCGLVLCGLGMAGCGADTGPGASDAAADAGIDAAIGAQDAPKLDGAVMDSLAIDDGPPADAQPTVSVEASVAFAEIAGTYAASAAKVSGAGSALFENGQAYTFSVNANGTVSVATKAAAEVFTWATHGKKITRNTKNNVTVIEFEEAGKRLLNITYIPGTGPFDVAGVMVDPVGLWYLTSISKM